MLARRRLILGSVLVMLGAAAFVAGLSNGFSGGAPAGSGLEGCTCHASTPDPDASIAVEWPERIEPARTYNLTVRVVGPDPLPPPVGRNAGGFALQAAKGNLSAADASSQLRGGMLTHTQEGNDQRSWRFAWTAPPETELAANETIALYAAANAVNGDGLANNLDAWTNTTMSGVVELPPPEPEPTPTTSPTESPAVGAGAVAAALGGLAAWRRLAGRGR